MITAMSGTIPNTDTHCDEAFLLSEAPDGTKPPSRGSGFDANHQIWLLKECTNNARVKAWTSNPASREDITIITFCPSYLTTWTQAQNTQTLQQLQSTTVPQGTSLQSVVDRYLAGTLIHEFTHMRSIFGNELKALYLSNNNWFTGIA
ncbi:hypothetical protein PRZ48_006741 [Zasmidium cellare]|uniref:Lysine-specific metallo-endopeptidase domain-containing protein n=1 Tax=Zasmidium cellare TaxID=395010 RepID=A0ABR0EQ31_ZASCE|nr:hypothetical protein PRZ48_006741 [Zasmidium cellare]